MQYTEEQIEQIYQRIIGVIKQEPHALTVQQIAEQTGLDESEVKQALSELDEVHKVSGEVVHADKVAAQVGCSVEEARKEFGGDVVVIPDLYMVLG